MGGHFLGWTNYKLTCPHCRKPDSIEHTFFACECLGEQERHALRKSLHPSRETTTEKRVQAVNLVIQIGIERERKVTHNKVLAGVDMTGRKVKITDNEKTWRNGEVKEYDTTTFNAKIEFENGDVVQYPVLDGIRSKKCWIRGLCSYVHPNHQVEPSFEAVPAADPVLRADGHIVADSKD